MRWLALMTALLAMAGTAVSAQTQMASPSLVIDNLNVIPMEGEVQVLPRQSLLITNGRIAYVGPAAGLDAPADTRRIDGGGRWVIPGLSDMHIHLENDRLLRLYTGRRDLPDGTVDPGRALAPYIFHGVLQVANLGAMSEAVGLRGDVEAGRVLGPHLALGAMIDAPSSIWPFGFTRHAVTPEEGRQAVSDIQAESYDFVKIYSALAPETAQAVIDEAARRGMRVAGHLPRGAPDDAPSRLRSGFGLVTHAEEFAYQTDDRSEARARRFAQEARNAGVWLVPTLTLNERLLEQARGQTLDARCELSFLNPVIREIWVHGNRYPADAGFAAEMDSVVRFNRLIVRAFHEAGVPILAGTDSLTPGVAPGYALHDELEALSRAGLTNDEVLTAATRSAAVWLGVDDDRGSIVLGKRADLVLLDRNPLEDIRATRAIWAVVRDGRLLTRQDLDALKTLTADNSSPAC